MTDALSELEQLLERLPTAVQHRRIGESLGQTAETLKEAPRHIQRMKAVAAVARETCFDSDASQKNMLKNFSDLSIDLSNMMINAQTAENLREVRENYSDFIKELPRLETNVRRHCQSVIDSEFNALGVIGALLKKIDGAADLAERLVALALNARQTTSTPMIELHEAIPRLRRRRADLDAERRSFTKDAEVDNFFNALADNRATLAHVTPMVRDWLAEHGALDRFAVRTSA